jgi:hypothetical protein
VPQTVGASDLRKPKARTSRPSIECIADRRRLDGASGSPDAEEKSTTGRRGSTVPQIVEYGGGDVIG